MEETSNAEKAIQAQQECRKEYAKKHPRDWASSMIKRGEGFARWMDVVTAPAAEGQVCVGGRRPTGQKKRRNKR